MPILNTKAARFGAFMVYCGKKKRITCIVCRRFVSAKPTPVPGMGKKSTKKRRSAYRPVSAGVSPARRPHCAAGKKSIVTKGI